MEGVKLLLYDFNDLYVLAAGLSMAYICLETKGDKGQKSYSFLMFLTRIVQGLQSCVITLRSREKETEETVIARIEFLISTGKLKAKTEGALSQTCSKAREFLEKYKTIENWSERKLRFHFKTDYLNVISYDCFLYAMALLYLGVIEKNWGVNISSNLYWISALLILFWLHCISIDRKSSNTRINCDVDNKWRRYLAMTGNLLIKSLMLKTEDIHPPKTGISVHFSDSLA